MLDDGPRCPFGPHAKGIEVSDWEPAREAPIALANGQGPSPARRTITEEASVRVVCRQHRVDERVGVGADWRPPGHQD